VTTRLEHHPLADLFPRMRTRELADLVADIRDNGVLEPIVLLDGKVLDGRNRLAACERLSLTPPFTKFDGGDALTFVISKNLHRRHLNDAQRAFIAARLMNARQGRRKADGSRTTSEAAALLNVRRVTVTRAKHVLDNADASLIALAVDGRLSISAARGCCHLTKADQKRLVDQGPGAVVAFARKARVKAQKAKRSDYAFLWDCVDDLIGALETKNLVAAHIKARKLERLIDAAARGVRE
jgi:ParB-like chromosome segregation protein Spo0J